MKLNWCFLILSLILILYILKPRSAKFNPRCVALYWTGGFDSTFRLLQLILIEKKCVQPIYLNFDQLDGVRIRRQNVQFELATMDKIVNEIHKLGFGHLLYPLRVVTRVKLSPEVLKATTIMAKREQVRRAISQYAHMIQYSLDKNIIIDECAEKSLHSTSYNMVTPYLNKNKMVDLEKVSGMPLYVLRNIRFPIIDLTKKDMLAIAKKHKFDYILKWTKSCWWPDKDGTPCRKCLMCKTRMEELPSEMQETFHVR